MQSYFVQHISNDIRITQPKSLQIHVSERAHICIFIAHLLGRPIGNK